MCGVYIGVDEMDGDDEGTFVDSCKPGGDTPKGLKVGVDTPFHNVGCLEVKVGVDTPFHSVGCLYDGSKGDGDTSR